MPPLADEPVGAFLDALASDASTPGGGAAAGLSGATAAALMAMVARLTAGKKGFDEVTPEMSQLAAARDELRAELLGLADADARVFDDVMAAYRLPKASDEDKAARLTAIEDALDAACQVPLALMETAVQVIELGVALAEHGNPRLASDAVCGAVIGRAAVLAAHENVAINVGSMTDEGRAASYSAEGERLVADAERIAAAVIAAVDARAAAS